MDKNTIGNIILSFAIINSFMTLFRVYLYFFTGKDITPLQAESNFGITIALLVITGMSYLVALTFKGIIK